MMPGLELGDLDSVARFAADVRAEYTALDLLVNNAGTGRAADPVTAQGFESVFATNHLGYFALTGHLLDLLRQAKGTQPVGGGQQPRVVSVGSNLYRRMKVSLPLHDLTAEVPPARAYVASKLAVLLFAGELDRRLRATRSPVRSLAAHPGVAATAMQQQAGNPLEWAAGRALHLVLGRSADAGAIPLLFSATAPGAPADRVLGPSLRKRDLRVHADPIRRPATDRTLAQRLWNVSEAATGVRIASTPAPKLRQRTAHLDADVSPVGVWWLTTQP